MANNPLSRELAIETMRIYNTYNRNLGMCMRMTKIPRTTMQSRLRTIKVQFPDLYQNDNSDHRIKWTYPQQEQVEFSDGVVLIGSDAHIWPGEWSIMMKAFAQISRQLKPKAIVLNGDIIDGARVSRHGSLLRSYAPKITDEIDAARGWIETLPPTEHCIWTMGNHDQRVDTYLANNAPELDDYAGTIADRFKDWKFCWSVNINNVEIRHRFRSGIHAGWNNALHAGLTIVTGHTHQLQMTAVRNRNGTHWGIECGMLGDPNSRAFEYSEGAPNRANPGFVVLTFVDDQLLPPEFCELINGRPVFRGEFIF
jgi:predicted phosphodiesterase